MEGFYDKNYSVKEEKVKESITIKETVDFLNEILSIDKDAINALFSMRIGYNNYLAKHKTVQVGKLGKDYHQVGMVGIINGLFGIDKFGWGHITADYEDGKIVKFRLLTEEEVESFQNV